MNTKQKEIAEKIITLMKEKEGYIYHLDSQIKGSQEDRIVITRGMKDLDLIEEVSKGGSTYRLTEKGWDFTSFSEYEKDKERDESIKDYTLQNLRRGIF